MFNKKSLTTFLGWFLIILLLVCAFSCAKLGKVIDEEIGLTKKESEKSSSGVNINIGESSERIIRRTGKEVRKNIRQAKREIIKEIEHLEDPKKCKEVVPGIVECDK